MMNLDQLNEFLLEKEPNSNERVALLIGECIRLGTDKGTEIVETICSLGYNIKHVGLQLSINTGRRGSSHLFQKLPCGRYSTNN